jgi:hypothetical protein
VGQIQEWKQNANLGFQVSPISQLIKLKMWLIALLFQRYYCRESTLNFLRILLGSWVSAVSMKGTALQAVNGYCCYLNIEKGYSDV